MTSTTIPDSVTTIGYCAFNSCNSLKNVSIGSGLTNIHKTAFNACYNLTSINVSSDNNHFLSYNGVLFNKSMTDLLQYPAGNSKTSYTIPDGVTNICDYAFYGCKFLINIILPDSIININQAAFIYCNKITNVYYSGGEKTEKQ